MIFKVNVKKYWSYKLFYTVLIILACLVPILIAIDPIEMSSAVGISKGAVEANYTISAYLGEITIYGSLGILSSLKGQIFSADAVQVSGDNDNGTRTGLFIGPVSQFNSVDGTTRTMYKDPNGGVMYKSGTYEITVVDKDSFRQNMSGSVTISYALFAIGSIILVGLIIFVWLTCEGWCRCNSPCREGETISGDFI